MRALLIISALMLLMPGGIGITSATPAIAQEDGNNKRVGYIYKSTGRRDPFASIIETAKRSREARKKSKGVVPLESYSVNQVKLIAIIWNNTRKFATVGLPDSKFYTLKPGTSIGLHGGEVHEITNNSVIVREFKPDYKGRLKAEDTVLKLRNEGDR